jgi:hypothetical protein
VLSLFEPVGDSASCQVVGREFHQYLVTRQYSDEVLSDLSRCVCQNFVTVRKFNLEERVRKSLVYETLYFDCFLFCQITFSPFPCCAYSTVRTSGPSSVIATVCSKWQESLPSSVTTVQPSSSMRVFQVPTFTIGSIARTRPGCISIP